MIVTPLGRSLRPLVPAAALPALLVAGAAPAQEPPEPRPPVVTSVWVNGAPSRSTPDGGVVVVLGRRFHSCRREGCRHEDVEVTIGGEPAFLLEATAEEIYFIVPNIGVPAGRRDVRIVLDRRREVTVPLEVVDARAWPRDLDAQGAFPPGPTPRPDAPPQVEAEDPRLPVDAFRWVPGQRRFLVAGRVHDGPRDLAVSLVLGYQEEDDAQPRPVLQRPAEVIGGRFTAALDPPPGRVPSGAYVLMAFVPEDAPEDWRGAVTRTRTHVGAETDLRAERRERDAELAALLAEAEARAASLDAGTADALRALFADADGVDEPAWRAALERAGATVPSRPASGWRFTSPRGVLRTEAWRAWTSDVREETSRLRAGLARLIDGWAVVPDPSSVTLARGLLDALQALAASRSELFLTEAPRPAQVFLSAERKDLLHFRARVRRALDLAEEGW